MVVRDSRLVDKGIKELEKFSANTPSFDPDRRKFLKHVAVLAGLYASGQLLKGCAVTEPIEFQGKTYSNWEADLLREDLIRGPRLLIHPRNLLPNDFLNHLENPVTRPNFGAVDYDVSVGTPIVPTTQAYRSRSYMGNGWQLNLYHRERYFSLYVHLDKYAEMLSKGKSYKSPTGFEYMDQLLDKSKIVAFSGNTGVGPGGRPEPPHLHFEARKIEGNEFTRPGIDPFKAGIDAKKPVGEYGGRPVYWDGKTEIVYTLGRIKGFLEWQDTLEAKIKESDVDRVTKEELLKRQTKLDDLRDYVGMRVLTKKSSAPDGKPRYEFMPGSFMYALMLESFNKLRDTRLEFTAMLPFIFPPLKEVYQKANPGVQL